MGDMVSGWARRSASSTSASPMGVKTYLLALLARRDIAAAGLQLLQYFLRAGDDLLRQSRELGDLDAVAAVGSAGNDLAEEYKVLPALFDGDVVVFHARERALQLGELVVVGGEERFRAEPFAVGAELEHRAGDAHAVEGRGAAADLV